MDGTELASRFSYITNSLRFCGPKEACRQFLKYANKKDGKSLDDVRESIKKFEGLYPYLSSIAEKNSKDFLDYEVVEAYWIGNRLLEKLNDEDIKQIIGKLMYRGLPKSIGESLIKNLPHGFAPHHNFNVFYVGVGRTSGTVETNLQNMDNCRISWGKVAEVHDSNLIVKTQSLKNENGKFFLSEDETKTAVYFREMLPKIKKNDMVALHWGFACCVLDEGQLGNLKKYSKKIIDIMNLNKIEINH